jgi:hypothetical protein
VLEQNYSTPYNTTTKINWQSPVISWQTLKIFDVHGNEVATLLVEYKPAGKYVIEWNADGFTISDYFYQLKVKDFLEKKFLLLKSSYAKKLID